MDRMLAYVGSWGLKPGPKGIRIYRYDPKTAELEFLRTVHEDVSVGNQYLDKGKGVLYVTDESGRPIGDTVGGRVLAFSMEKTDGLRDLNTRETLLPKPSYIYIEHTGKFALVAHHSNRGQVTKLGKNADGSFFSKTVTDDAGLALFSVKDDGRLGEILDFVLTPGEKPYSTHALSHQHCVNEAPFGDLFLVCDKGLDKIYSFHLDRNTGTLKLINTTELETGTAPRYVAFHPMLPIVYENNEKRPGLNTYRYEADTGKMFLLDSLPLAEKDGDLVQCGDMVMTQDGKRLFASVRGVNLIKLLDIDYDGIPHILQSVDCMGKNPRGLCLSPDGHFLLCANLDSEDIARFSVSADGTLTPAGEPVPARLPGNITIASV